MPRRRTILVNNEIYHVLSRSIAQIPIFKEKRDYQRALEIIDFYQHTKPSLSFSHYKRLPKGERQVFFENLQKKNLLVEILAFCLMPNHCHFLLKQKKEKGISNFMRNFQDSYACYFNAKYKRRGGLFQSMFKAIRIETDGQLLHVSRYIHLNPVSSYLIETKDLESYPWSSFFAYLHETKDFFVNVRPILSHFRTRGAYKKFVFDQAEYQRELQKIKHLALEE